jgi:hypothetical protein
MNRKQLIKFCEAVADMYGAKIQWLPGDSGGYWMYGNTIYVFKDTETHTRLISIFCHELAHYLNWKEGKYPIYHSKDYGKIVGKYFNTIAKITAYAHRAEVYTEKRGKALAKTFFPGVKYQMFYKTGSVASHNFMYGYLLQHSVV